MLVQQGHVVRIQLLGGLEVNAVSGEPIRFRTRKASLLLASLVLVGQKGIRREVLCEALWPDRAGEQARSSLRQALVDLRRAFPEHEGATIRIDGGADSLQLTADPGDIDAWRFDRLLAESEPAELVEAADLYRGDILAEIVVPEPLNLRFAPYQRAYRRKALQLAERLSLLTVPSRTFVEAACERLCERLLASDAADEEAHRVLIRLYQRQDRANIALRQFELCREALQTALGVEPEAQTYALIANRPVLAPAKGPETSSQIHIADRPSIAVLPFTNLSGDPQQDYFVDGIVEDIISGLTRLHWLFVIASDSSFTFKNKPLDVKQVGRELGVRYVLEGSMRKAGDRVRIASQLINASTGTHIWADRFDGGLNDIFDLQDQITAKVVGAIEPKLRHAEIERASRKPTASVDAYDLFLRAVALNNTRKEKDNKEALQLLSRAIEIDPQYAAAYGLASYCYLRQKAQGFTSSADPLPEGMRMARLAAEYGSDDPEALWMAGVTMSILAGEFEDGLALIEKSLALNPNSANALMAGGLVRAQSGDADSAFAFLERSRQLSPLDPIAYGTSLGFAWAHFSAGRYREASASCDRTLREAPITYPPALHVKIACDGLLGRLEEGHKSIERLLAITPEARISSLCKWYRLFIKKPASLEPFLDGLRRAGLPE